MISKYTRDGGPLTTLFKHSYRQNINGVIDSQMTRNTHHHRQKRSVKSFVKDRFMQINKGNGVKDAAYMAFDIENRLSDDSCEKNIEDKAISGGLNWLEDKMFKASPIGRALDIGTFLFKHRSCILSPCDCLDTTEQVS